MRYAQKINIGLSRQKGKKIRRGNLTDAEFRKKQKGLCIIRFCPREAKCGNYCYTCRQRRYAEKNPIAYTFNSLKQNAKRRGHECSLTIEEFTSWVEENGYMEGKGKTKMSLSIDRKDDRYGYHIWNIQAMLLSENSKKAQRRKRALAYIEEREARKKGLIPDDYVPQDENIEIQGSDADPDFINDLNEDAPF